MQIRNIVLKKIKYILLFLSLISCNAFEVISNDVEAQNELSSIDSIYIESVISVGGWETGVTLKCKSTSVSYIEVQGRNFFGPLAVEFSNDQGSIANNIVTIDFHSENTIHIKVYGDGILENKIYNIRIYNSNSDETFFNAFSTPASCA